MFHGNFENNVSGSNTPKSYQCFSQTTRIAFITLVNASLTIGRTRQTFPVDIIAVLFVKIVSVFALKTSVK